MEVKTLVNEEIVLGDELSQHREELIGDFQSKLGNVQLEDLTVFQRMLLVANGTLTRTLESIFLEKIDLVKLAENVTRKHGEGLHLDLNGTEELLNREILLKGRNSNMNFVYAQSSIVLDRLDDMTRDGLVNCNFPIGKIWNQNKVELFKEFTGYGMEPAGNLAKHFNLQATDDLFRRTYRVIIGGVPVFQITERYPDLHPVSFGN